MSFKTRVTEVHGRRLSTIDVASLQMLGTPLSLNKDTIQEMTPSRWIKEPQFYLVSVIYTSARLFVCISQSYIIFYIQDTLALSKQYVSIVPLAILLAGLGTSCVLKTITRRIGLKVSFILCSMVGLGILISLCNRISIWIFHFNFV